MMFPFLEKSSPFIAKLVGYRQDGSHGDTGCIMPKKVPHTMTFIGLDSRYDPLYNLYYDDPETA